MTILYLEPVGGIAGDMFLAAAVDLGVSLAEIEKHLRTLDVPGWSFQVGRQTRHTIEGTHLDVLVDQVQHPREAPHSHDHDHEHEHEHEHGRAYSDIKALIEASALPERAKTAALRVFRIIGEAEAKVHGVSLEKIHFHEVGAVDSIVDVCGAAVVMHLLGWPTVHASPPPLGSGTAKVAHGIVPVPVPATLEILRDVPVRFEGLGELTTPTGAAIIKAFASVTPPPPMVVERIGYGVGTRDFADRANVLRASVGQPAAAAASLQVLECTLDDITGQLLGALIESLMKAGALDVWVLPCTMKKGRPGHLLGALVDGAQHDAVLEALLAESTTLGVREHAVSRTVLGRRFETVQTSYGPVRIKLGLDGDRLLNAAPEFDECRALAEQARVPVKEVLAAALAAFRR